MSESEEFEFEDANISESGSDDTDEELDSGESENNDQTTDTGQEISRNVLKPAPLHFQFLGVLSYLLDAKIELTSKDTYSEIPITIHEIRSYATDSE
ncbi:hypothetical protein FQA39_LY02622 [Lamprigera yunnana]|nr:hypothetical protein FQA39_LY02622 [Lamprigera yunnana]